MAEGKKRNAREASANAHEWRREWMRKKRGESEAKRCWTHVMDFCIRIEISSLSLHTDLLGREREDESSRSNST